MLHRGGYDLKGIYSLEEYYARDLAGYYRAIAVDAPHNYYLGRATADISGWVEYFCLGMADAFSRVRNHARQFSGMADQGLLLRELDARQKLVLEAFRTRRFLGTRDIDRRLGRLPAHRPEPLQPLDGRGVSQNVATNWDPINFDTADREVSDLDDD